MKNMLTEPDFNKVLFNKIIECTSSDITGRERLIDFIKDKKFTSRINNMSCQRCVYKKPLKHQESEGCLGTMGEFWVASLLESNNYEIKDMYMMQVNDNTPDIVVYNKTDAGYYRDFNFEVKVINFKPRFRKHNRYMKEYKNIDEVAVYLLHKNRDIKWRLKDNKENKRINCIIMYGMDFFDEWVSFYLDRMLHSFGKLNSINYPDKNLWFIGMDSFDFNNTSPVIYQVNKGIFIKSLLDQVNIEGEIYKQERLRQCQSQ